MNDAQPHPAAGRIRPIVQVGHPALATRCEEITIFGEELAELVADMFATMAAADGVGLAANQIGVVKRVFVYDCPDETGRRQRGVVCNPVLAELAPQDRHLDVDQEGCLSVQGQFAELGRPDFAAVSGVDEHGHPIRVEGDGLLARCLQHETDHLDGMLYIDRLAAKSRKNVLAAWREDQPAADWPAS